MTALEYAEKAAHNDVAELLRVAEIEHQGGPAVETGAAQRLRCPECGELIRLGNLRRICARVRDGDEPSAHVRAFVQSPAYDALVANHRFHRVLSGKKLRKEITESWAVIRAIERVIEQQGLSNAVVSGSGSGSGSGAIIFVDLCCGKSLTSTLLTVLYPSAKVIAIDRLGNCRKRALSTLNRTIVTVQRAVAVSRSHASTVITGHRHTVPYRFTTNKILLP